MTLLPPDLTGPPAVEDLAVALADAARDLQAQHEPAALLDAVVRWALLLVPGAEEGSVSLVRRRRTVHSQAATGDLARRVDALQEEVGEGPGLSAAYDAASVRVADLTGEARWPLFSARAAALGACSVLALRLHVEGDDLGALTLHGRVAGAFDDRGEQVGLLLAAHAAVAYAGARREAALHQALDTRQVVGQAQGVLMQRDRLSAAQAYDRLVDVSQARNLKLHDVAARLASTGELP